MVDFIVIGIGLVTLLLVINDQWPKWYPFRLLGSDSGQYPLPEDPHRVRDIHISRGQSQFVIRLAPRVGGFCTDVSAMFQRPATPRERVRPHDKQNTAIHFVSPDLIDIITIRIILPTTPEPRCVREKTVGARDVFRLDPKVELTPNEPVTCVVTARINKPWKGEFSLRLKVSGVTRGRVVVNVEATP